MNLLLKYQKPFSLSNTRFGFIELFREAMSIACKNWLLLLSADLILIIVTNTPILMPMLGAWFPALKAFQIHPTGIESDTFLAHFMVLSKILLPYLFTLFITAPVYFGVNLLALRIVYQKPTTLFLLQHYLRLSWFSAITTLLFFSGIIIAPLFFALKFLTQIAGIASYTAQFYVGIVSLGIITLIIIVFSSMTLQLIFGARLKTLDAIYLSWRGVRMHTWKIFIMFLLLYAVQYAHFATHYLSDLLLMPPTAIAWALLYKRIYGACGLVE